MAVDAIGGSVGTGLGELTRSGVSQEDFIRLFLTQLNFQDPLEPVDNREFLAQLAQFSSVEQLRTLGENIDALLGVQASGQALGLLGRTVEVATESGSAIGQVTTLNYRSGKPLLTITQTNGNILPDVSPSQVLIVR
ncbi:flagellar hook assembly protein FlgD [Solimonas sp. SE-A11]|uniref:flagellar hook assembly protein FlgD n=1 Tax=Solimonas sp. SE-A11 TaxID=3054954 RepID=UPI00259CEF01|nr:flagellar hook capping FlgD N-terminal domain-containing protein [Solimonas sp. SE-A11]MDM4772918.1 flagellar hook capping FlgD N-terminal domain-containing protein [Solimonas sp. SE-A11]